MKRRLLSFVLVLCMLLAMVPVVTTEAAATSASTIESRLTSWKSGVSYK